MKLSKLILSLQMRLEEYGDKEVVIIRQTDPDSWVRAPVTAVSPPQRGGGKKSYVVLE